MPPASEMATSGGNEVQDKPYPAPLCSHEEVVNNPSLFFDTLKQFHSSLGSKFMVPVIGGKELDLHVLYVEVTKRGGFDKVVAEKKWREISGMFNFSATATSASYVLKKHYITILHSYEQVYFFKLLLQRPTSALLSSPEANSASKLVRGPKINSLPEYPKFVAEEEKYCGLNAPPKLIEANGTIDGKFECGYLVTVKLGSEVFNGVMYHPSHPKYHTIPTTKPSAAIVPYNNNVKAHISRRKRRKRRYNSDPNRPKANRSGYNFFFAETHMKLKSARPEKEREFTKIIGQSWNNLTPDEKSVYQNIGLKDKERYTRELKEYKERTKQEGNATMQVAGED